MDRDSVAFLPYPYDVLPDIIPIVQNTRLSPQAVVSSLLVGLVTNCLASYIWWQWWDSTHRRTRLQLAMGESVESLTAKLTGAEAQFRNTGLERIEPPPLFYPGGNFDI